LQVSRCSEQKTMKTKRRIIFRTETYERISLRRTSETTDCRVFTLGNYKVEISKIEPKAERIIFETEVSGFIEIKDNDNEIQLNIHKI
jgi:hypothetical protein